MNYSIKTKNSIFSFGMNQQGKWSFRQMLFANSSLDFAASEQPALWQLEVIDSDDRIVTLQPETEPAADMQDNQLTMSWDIAGYCSVTVTAFESQNDAGAVELKLHVNSLSTQWSLRQVHFPCFNWQLVKGENCKLIQPEDAGIVFPDPLTTLPSGGAYVTKKFRDRAWPNGFLSMQFMALEIDGILAYMGAHDPDALVKSFNWECDREKQFLTFRPHIHTPRINGGDYSSFPWVFAISPGDWFDAATRYRRYALNAPWMKHGPLEYGKKTPKWFIETPLVSIHMYSQDGYRLEDTLREAEFFDVPMLVHYYTWSAVNNIDFPTTPNFRHDVKVAAEHNVRIMPYMDFYSFDVSMPLWQSFSSQAITVDEKGTISGTAWPPNSLNLAAMCAHAPFWKNHAKTTALRMAETGVGGIYWDEFGMSPALVCHSEDHGHTPGDPKVYLSSITGLLQEVKEETKDIYPNGMIFTSEGAGEPLIGEIDSFLIGNDNSPYMKPIFAAVYHDYVLGFGRYMFNPELNDPRFAGAILTKNAEQFICGWQFGWSRIPWCMFIDRDPETAEFIRMLAKIRIKHSKYLVCGKMLKPLELDVPHIKQRWARSWNDSEGTIVDLPAIMNSVWQCDDSSTELFLVNITDEEVTFTFCMFAKQLENTVNFSSDSNTIQIDGKDAVYNYPLPEPSPCYGTLYTVDGEPVKFVMDGNTRSGFKVTMPPRSVLVQQIPNSQGWKKIHFC